MKRVYFIVLFFLCCAQHSTFAQWTIGPSLPTGRVHPGAATVKGTIYVIGGFYGSTNYTTNEALDSATHTWVTKAPMPTGRGRLAISAGEGDSIIYAVGGHGAQNTVEVYNINTNTWATRAPIVQGRLGAIAGFINGKLYVAGGTSFDTVNTLEEYDPGTNTWSFKARMPTPRYLLAGGVIGNKLYAIGGTNSYTGGSALATVEAYDPSTNTWATKGSLVVPVSNTSAAVLIDDRIYVAGGFGGIGAGTAFQIYDKTSDFWWLGTPLSCSRGELVVAKDGWQCIYAIAGNDAPGGTVYDTVEVFCPYILKDKLKKIEHTAVVNYPNPCDQSTTIQFELPVAGFASVTMYNVNGQKVVTPLNSYMQGGKQAVEISTADLPAGAYYYRLETTGYCESKKIIVVH